MKKLLLFSMCVLLSISYTQSQSKTKPPEQAPDQQDIQQMMKDTQKELDNMSPEDNKDDGRSKRPIKIVNRCVGNNPPDSNAAVVKS
jgi:hypothetical protein